MSKKKKPKAEKNVLTLKGCMFTVGVVAASENTQFSITGVMLRRKGGKNRVVATDGRRMMCAEIRDDGPAVKDMILPRAFVKKFVKDDVVVLTRDTIEMRTGVVDRVHGEVNGESKTAYLMGGKFPDIDDVIPKEAKLRIGFNMKLLREMLQCFEKIAKGDEKTRPIVLEFVDKDKSMKMTYENDDGVKVTGVLMPLAIPKSRRGRP